MYGILIANDIIDVVDRDNQIYLIKINIIIEP